MLKRNRKLFFVLAGAILLLSSVVAFASHDIPAWLTEVMDAPDAPTYTIYYATECPDDEPDCTASELVPPADSDGDGFPDAVEEMSNYLEGARTAFVSTFGMNEPYFNDAPNRPAYMTGGCWGSYNGHRMLMCAQGTSSDPVQAEATAIHELFHGTQWAYGVSQPTWVIEGQAAMVEDTVTAALDGDPGTFLFSKGNAYLSDPNRHAITRASYPAAWFWKYFSERYGTLANPGQGMDAIATFWDASDTAGASGITAVNAAMGMLDSGTTFTDIYQDFVIANYARKLSGPSVPSIYYFADEAEASPGPLNAVALDVNDTLGADDQVGPLTSDVNAWGVRYYAVSPAADVPVISINVRQDLGTAGPIFYAVLGVKDNDLVLEERYVSRDLNRALPNDDYDKVVVIVAGLQRYANYRLSINGSEPSLSIIDPIQGRTAQVGDPASPDKFLLKVEALDPLGEPIEGIDPADFSVTVGSETISGMVTSAYVSGQYWLLLNAPSQTTGGLYDLSVAWTSLSDSELNAVEYVVQPDAANVLVIDRSGSMSNLGKMTAAQNSARLYVDSWRDGEQIGVTSFNENATVDLAVQTLNSTSRADAKNAIDALTAGGNTSIGDGLIAGLNQLIANGDADNIWALVVLSDGIENRDERVSDFLALYDERQDDGDKVPRVHTVALGADADRTQMQTLADQTDGVYLYLSEPTTAAAAVNSPNGLYTGDTELDLAEIYRLIGEEVANQQQIFSERVTLDGSTSVQIPVDANAQEAVFTLSWHNFLSPAEATLERPDGSTLSVSFNDANHFVWRETNPQDGTWTLTLDCAGIEFCDDSYLVEVALKSPLTFDLFINTAPDGASEGLPVDILAAVTDAGPILDATVMVNIARPSGFIDSLTLYDDGRHGDGAADDGLYGNRYYATDQTGSYAVSATASGTSNLGSPFNRHLTRAFDVAFDGDQDQDGLPDSWEEEYGTNPLVPDSDSDPDEDGLSTGQEYELGTNPFNPDTDGGGESDGSEVSQQKDPHDPEDDGIQFTGEIYIKPGNGFVVIEYPVLPNYAGLLLLRSTSPDGGFQNVAQLQPTGLYTDTTVTNGQTYYYRLSAVAADGSTSWPTDAAGVTPKADPLPPDGFVLINNGEATTSDTAVMLTLGGSDDGAPHTPDDAAPLNDGPPAEMRIANEPTFANAVWEPFATSKAWTLNMEAGPAVVYVQYRDAAENESRLISDAIIVESGNTIYLPFVIRP